MLSLISCSGTRNSAESRYQESAKNTTKGEIVDSEQIENNSENIINIASMGSNDSFYVSEFKVYDFSYDGSKASIVAFDISSGKKLWSYKDEWEKVVKGRKK